MSHIRRLRATIGLILGIVAMPALVVGGPAGADPRAVEIVRESVQREARATYQGIQETRVTGVPRPQATEQFVKHKAPDKHRVEYLAPPRLRGNVMVDDGRNAWFFIRARGVVERSPSTRQSAKRVQQQLVQAVKRRDARLEYLGEEVIAGRKAYGVAITAMRVPGRRREVWVDQEYGVVLRARDTAPGGRVTETVFKQIEFDIPIADGEFVWDTPPGVVEAPRGPGRVLPLARARQLARRAWGALLEPRYLPRGFAFRSAHELRIAGERILHLRFSDGERILSIFQGLVGTPGPVEVGVRGRESNFLPFRRGRVYLLIVGPLPIAELQKIADSVE